MQKKLGQSLRTVALLHKAGVHRERDCYRFHLIFLITRAVQIVQVGTGI